MADGSVRQYYEDSLGALSAAVVDIPPVAYGMEGEAEWVAELCKAADACGWEPPPLPSSEAAWAATWAPRDEAAEHIQPSFGTGALQACLEDTKKKRRAVAKLAAQKIQEQVLKQTPVQAQTPNVQMASPDLVGGGDQGESEAGFNVARGSSAADSLENFMMGDAEVDREESTPSNREVNRRKMGGKKSGGALMGALAMKAGGVRKARGKKKK